MAGTVPEVLDWSGDMARLQRWHDGEKAYLPFSAAEMRRRQDGLRAHMVAHAIDACLLTSYHNVCYLSGFLYCAFGRRYGLVVDHEGATVIAPAVDGGHPWRRSAADVLTYTDWRRDNFAHAVRHLAAGARRLGVEFDHLTLDGRRLLEAALPGVELVDVGAAAMWLRAVKSPEEIALVREGARIADIGGAACVAAVAPGVAEHEVALAATDAMVREIARAFPYVELMDTWTWLQSGINTDGAHNPVTNRTIEAGDILSLNCFPMIFGYYAALERTLFCRHVPEAHLRLWEVNCRVHRAGLDLIRPGARCCDIAAELNEIYRAHGLLGYRTFGYGHSFGVICHYYGREAAVELREDVETALVPGMVVSMEPMITIPQGEPGAGGYREHDILVVTADGAENITGFPFGPEHNVVGG